MIDIITKEKRSWNMSRIKGKDTKPELLLRSMLHKAGFRFRIHDNKLPGKPDVVLPRFHTVVFVNGCFWHRHEGCQYSTIPGTHVDFWQKKFSRTIERDKEKANQLIQQGWNVITVWECELKKDPAFVLKKLTEELRGN